MAAFIKKSIYDIAVVGATGAVGMEMLATLKNRNFPVGKLFVYGSDRSIGKVIDTAFGPLTCKKFDVEEVKTMDFCLLAVSGDFSKQYAKDIAVENGAIVIDNSSAWRYDPDVPLCVPEINPKKVYGERLIANPNCTTAIAAVALYPLHVAYGLKKVIISTYQAASGAGAPGMKELEVGVKAYAAGEEIPKAVTFSHQLPFNVVPHIDKFQPNGYTKEEMKVMWETQKIFGDDSIKISCTAVRIPTFRAHAEAITVETERPVNVDKARLAIAAAPGVTVLDNPEENLYPMPLNATGKYDVKCGRIRESLVFGENGIDLFVCGDQLLKGAALNAVQIAEIFVK
jgi:aspartate-semialdehyde dehydrogenase